MITTCPSSHDRLVMDQKALYSLYLCLFIVASLGHSLAYFGPFSSELWWYLDGNYAWVLGIQRIMVVALLSIFALRNMRLISSQVSSNRLLNLFPKRRAARILFVLSLIGLPVLVYFLGQGAISSAEDKGREVAPQSEIKEVWLPYIWYSLYVYALWGGMFIYFLYCVTVSGINDINWIRANGARLVDEIEKQTATAQKMSAELDNVEMLFQSHVEAVRDIGQRNAVAVLVLVLALMHERLLAESVTLISHELAKSAILCMMLFTVVVVVLVLRPYAKLWENVSSTSMMLAAKTSSLGDTRGYGRWISFYRIVKTENSPGRLVRAILMGGGVSMSLIVSVAGFAFNVLGGKGDGFIDVSKAIIPEWLIESICNLIVFLGSQSPH